MRGGRAAHTAGLDRWFESLGRQLLVTAASDCEHGDDRVSRRKASWAVWLHLPRIIASYALPHWSGRSFLGAHKPKLFSDIARQKIPLVSSRDAIFGAP
jgi:hypothetical protein